MIPRLILIGLLAAVVVSGAAHHHHHSKSSSKPSKSGSTSGSFTTSGPESEAKSTLAAPPTATQTNSSSSSTTVSRLSRLGDLSESPSAQSNSVVQAPSSSSSSSSKGSFRRAAASPSTTSTSTTTTTSTSSTPRDLLTSTSSNSHQHHHLIRSQAATATSGGSTLNMPYAQQQAALMRAKPGQFTLVSNQQLGPGHVTMIGYTTPIVKVGGIVKVDQVAPGTMLPSGPVSSASSTIYSSSSSSSASSGSMFPGDGGQPMVSHHSQLINHGVAQKEGAPAANSSPSEAGLLQDSPAQQEGGGRGRGSPRAELSASPGSSPYGSALLGELPPGYSFAPQPTSDLRSLPSPFGLSYQFSPESLSGHRSAKLQQSPQQMTFSAPMEKPKPFLVFKPGYEGKMKQMASAPPPPNSPYGAQTGPMMMMVNQPPLGGGPSSSSAPPSYQQLFQQQQQPQSSFQPLSPISMATAAAFGGGIGAGGQPKPLEKSPNPSSPYSHLLPINDLEGNDLNSGPLVPSQVMPPFESQRTSGVSGANGGQFGLMNQGGGRPQPQSLSVAKQQQMSMEDSFAPPPSQQRSPNGLRGGGLPQGHQSQPLSMMPMPLHHQQMLHQKMPPPQQQGPSAFEQSMMQQQNQQQMSPKMFGQPMQFQQQQQPQSMMSPNGMPHQQQQQRQLEHNPFGNPHSQQPFGLQSQFERPSSSNSPSKMSPFEQHQGGPSSFGQPESQVTSTIRMPESKGSKVDPRQELQDQINFVLQNSPNLSPGSRGRHREDIFKAVQESMLSDSENAISRPSITSSSSGGSSSSYFKQSPAAAVSSQGSSSFDLGSLSIDGLSQQVPSSSRPDSSSAEGLPPKPNPQSAYYPSSNMGFRPSLSSPSSRLIPDPSSSYYSRYNTENAHPFSPMEFSSVGGGGGGAVQPPIHRGTHSAAQASAALSRDYKVKLQQEITRYLNDQMDPSKQPNGPAASSFFSGGGGQQQMFSSMSPMSPSSSPQQPEMMNFQPPSPFNPSSMLKYASSPLRKVSSNLVDQRQHQYQHQHSGLLFDSAPGSRSPRDLAAASNSQPPQQQPQQIGGHHFVLGRHTEFVQSAMASQPASTAVKAPEAGADGASNKATSSPFSELMNALSVEANGIPSSEAAAKSLRGYSEWWKESAARPIVVHPLTTTYADKK